MAYESFGNPHELIKRVRETLERYDGKISVLKCDVRCKNGVFRKDTIVYIERNKLMQHSSKVNIEMKIYDCSERNKLGDYEPYKISDIYEISVEKAGELLDVLDNMFDVDIEKSYFHSEYVELMRKAKHRSINGENIIGFMKTLRNLSSSGVLMALVGKCIDREKDFYCFYDFILPAFLPVVLLSFFVIGVTNYVIKRKTAEFEEIVDKLHAEIMAEQEQLTRHEICTTMCHNDISNMKTEKCNENMRETLLHHLIFRVISFALITAAIITNLFSNEAAHFVLAGALAVCAIWGWVNTIILCIRIKNDSNFARKGFGFEPFFLFFLIYIISKYVIK